jgi:ATP-dependent DNA helicase RecG
VTPKEKTPKLRIEMALQIDTPIQFLKGVGPKLGDLLNKHGVDTILDLITWYPRAYEDRRAARNIASLKPDELVSLKAQVVNVKSFNMGKSRRKIYDITVRDSTGKVHCKYFRVPYKGYFERFQPNQYVRVIGKVLFYRGQIEFHHPDIQDFVEEASEDASKLLPIYPETEGITTRQLQKLVGAALAQLKESGYDKADMPPKLSQPAMKPGQTKAYAYREPMRLEKLPKWIREKYQLPELYPSLLNVHCPPSEADNLWTELKSPYHRRLIFE